jgi:hypothetical protein
VLASHRRFKRRETLRIAYSGVAQQPVETVVREFLPATRS